MDKRSAPKHVICVAVVDDEESACRSFSRLLRAAGFQPVTYSSTEALLEDEKGLRFDCLLLAAERPRSLQFGQVAIAAGQAPSQGSPHLRDVDPVSAAAD